MAPNSDILNYMDSASQQNNQESTFKPELEKDLITWVAPARPFKRRDKQFYLTTVSIAGIVCLILFLAEGAMPVILIISLIFLYYVDNYLDESSVGKIFSNELSRKAKLKN